MPKARDSFVMRLRMQQLRDLCILGKAMYCSLQKSIAYSTPVLNPQANDFE